MKIILVLSFILLFNNFVYSEDFICFNESDTKKLVKELKTRLVIDEQLRITQEYLQNCEKEKELLKGIIDTTNLKLEACETTLSDYKELINLEKKVLDSSKEPFWRKLLGSLGFIGLGILIGIISL